MNYNIDTVSKHNYQTLLYYTPRVHMLFLWYKTYLMPTCLQCTTAGGSERVVWRYPYIEEQTKQWPKGKLQKDKQRSRKHTYKTKNRVTWTPLKPGVNSGAPEG